MFEAIEQWTPKVEGSYLEAHFEDEVLRLVFKAPGEIPREAIVDINFDRCGNQAERLGTLVKMALIDIELARIGGQAAASRN